MRGETIRKIAQKTNNKSFSRKEITEKALKNAWMVDIHVEESETHTLKH